MDVVPVVSSWSTACPMSFPLSGPPMLFTQLMGFLPLHLADQADTMYRWSGSDHDFTGSNMWSASTKFLA